MCRTKESSVICSIYSEQAFSYIKNILGHIYLLSRTSHNHPKNNRKELSIYLAPFVCHFLSFSCICFCVHVITCWVHAFWPINIWPMDILPTQCMVDSSMTLPLSWQSIVPQVSYSIVCVDQTSVGQMVFGPKPCNHYVTIHQRHAL